MIKRILVVVDGTPYSNAATQYAIELAKTHAAQVTGIVAISDDAVERGAHSMGIGASYYARKLRETHEHELDEEANRILVEFSMACSESDVPNLDVKTRAQPIDAIVEESKYHDLLVMGLRTSSELGGKQGQDLLIRLTREGIIPTLAVSSRFRPVEHVLYLYDGSVQSARSLQMYVTSGIFANAGGTVLTLSDSDSEESDQAETFNAEMAQYLDAHGRHCRRKVDKAMRKDEILDFASEIEADLIVMGAYGKSKIMQFFLGSLTKTLIRSSTVNLYLHH